MQFDKLEQELNKKIIKSIYLLYGEEKYLLENIVAKIKKNFGELQEGINYCCLDESNIQNIISEIETPSFGFDKKLIIINKAGLFNKETKKTSLKNNNLKTEKKSKESIKKPNTISVKLAEYINNNINIIKNSVVLVIIEEKIEKCTLLETLSNLENSKNENNGVVICEFQKLKLNELISRLKHICNLYKVQVAENTLSYLVEVSGTSMQNLMNEIRKLIEYVGENGIITKDDIDLLAIQNVDNIIFNLTDSLGTKNIKRALETLNDLIYLKEPLQTIMVNLYRHFKKLYFVKVSENVKDINIAELLDLKPNQMFLITKYKRQASYFTEKELRMFLERMLELDEKNKSGNIDLQLGLEVLIVGAGKSVK